MPLKMSKQSISLWALPVLLFALAVYIQSHLYIVTDVIWLLREGLSFFHGGEYYKDFIDPNPPMILYVYWPAIFLAEHTPMGPVAAVRLEVFILAWLVLMFAHCYLSHIVNNLSRLKHILFLASLSYCFFILPVDQFAQREHFLLILTFPYLISVMLLAQNRPITGRYLRLFIGLLAAIGFAIKPQFLFIPVMIELGLTYWLRQSKIIFRVEVLMIILVTLLHFISILIFAPNYIYKILPIVKHYYIGFHHTSINKLLANILGGCLFSALIVSLYMQKIKQNRCFFTFLTLAALASAILYLAAGRSLFYHTIPMVTYSVLIMMMGLGYFIEEIIQNSNKDMFMLFITTITIITLGILVKGVSTATKVYLDNKRPLKKVATRVIELGKINPKIKAVYSLSSYTVFSDIPAYYGNMKNCSRFSSLWMIPILVKKMSDPNNTSDEKQFHEQQANIIRKLIVEDFKRCPPDLVTVEAETNRPHSRMPVQFSYIDFMEQDPEFAKIWQDYVYIDQGLFFGFFVKKEVKRDSK